MNHGRIGVDNGPAEGIVEVADLCRSIHRIVKKGGGYQGIWYDHERGVLIGGTEARKDGCAAGY
jgi:gamma-glutamyltranspeptidase/glutathione hydrolase